MYGVVEAALHTVAAQSVLEPSEHRIPKITALLAGDNHGARGLTVERGRRMLHGAFDKRLELAVGQRRLVRECV